MTADTMKDSTHCLICNSKVGVSTRTSIRIFNESCITPSEKPLIETICAVLEKDVSEKTVHSTVICKKCYKLFTEYDELENRMAEIKMEIYNNYEKTMKKISPCVQMQEEYNDHDYIDNSDSQIVEALNSKYDRTESESASPVKNAQIEVETPAEAETEAEAKTSAEAESSVEAETSVEPETSAEVEAETKNEVEVEAEAEAEQITEYFVEEIDKVQMDEAEYIEESEVIPIKSESSTESEKNSEAKRNQAKKLKPCVKMDEGQEQIVTRDGAEYTCLLCTNEEEKFVGDAKEIVSHIKTVHDSRLYICDLCGMDFKKRNELSVHLDDHVAKEEGDFQCEVCNRIFSNLRLFRIHKRMHYPQVKSWPCETCGKRYSSKNLLEEHTNTHTGIRPYMCETCGKDFASKYTYKAHAKTHEVRPRPFECSQCNKSFLSQQNLNQHERTHNGVKEYVCHQCGKAFGSPHNLEVHNIVHTGYKPYICRMCGKAFARKAEIRDHERTHTGEKPYQCEFCGATFSQRSNLQSHKRATHYNDKRYKCDDCGKGFKRRRLLDYHIKAAHTGERPYKCETCTATFVYPEHFKKHMRIHTGEKPYLCEVCGKAFNSRDNRNAHRFIHSDKKPYECLVCGMGFMRKPLLYTHMQTQGHLNDTIVVNQPRLTTEEEQILGLPDGDVELMMEENDSEQTEETELYVAELKDHVIIQQGGEHIYHEENVINIPTEETIGEEEVNHMVVDGQMSFTENEVLQCKSEDCEQQVEEVYSYDTGDDGETIVVPATSEYKEIVGGDKVRLVQIRIPSSTAGEARSWLSLVQNT